MHLRMYLPADDAVLQKATVVKKVMYVLVKSSVMKY